MLQHPLKTNDLFRWQYSEHGTREHSANSKRISEHSWASIAKYIYFYNRVVFHQGAHLYFRKSRGTAASKSLQYM